MSSAPALRVSQPSSSQVIVAPQKTRKTHRLPPLARSVTRLSPLSESGNNVTPHVQIQQVTHTLAALSLSGQHEQTIRAPDSSQRTTTQTIIYDLEQTEAPPPQNLKKLLSDLIKELELSKSKANEEIIEIIETFEKFAFNLEVILCQMSPEDASTKMRFEAYRSSLMYGLISHDKTAVEIIISEKAPLPIFYLVIEPIDKWPNIFRIVANNLVTRRSISSVTRKAVVREFTEFADNIFKTYAAEQQKNRPLENSDENKSQVTK